MSVAQCDSDKQQETAAFFGVATANALASSSSPPSSSLHPLFSVDDIESQAPRATIGAVHFVEQVEEEKKVPRIDAQRAAIRTEANKKEAPKEEEAHEISSADVERAILTMDVNDPCDEIEEANTLMFIEEASGLIFSSLFLFILIFVWFSSIAYQERSIEPTLASGPATFTPS